MLRNIRERMESEKGFTLIELLVVILIIGILAAIAIPAFLGQRDKAKDSSAKSAVRNAASAIEAYGTEGGTYVGATKGGLEAIETSIKDVAAADFAISGLAADSYVLAVKSSTGTWYSIGKSNTGTKRCKDQTNACATSNW